MTLPWTTVDGPIGPLALVADADGAALVGLRFPGDTGDLDRNRRDAAAPALAAGAEALARYFGGDAGAFAAVPLELSGTPFQRAVWERLRAVPFGATTTYSEIARELGRPEAVRAVGAAVGRTPVPVIVPCHRVLGADGSLTGYLGGLERKAALLEHERSRRGDSNP